MKLSDKQFILNRVWGENAMEFAWNLQKNTMSAIKGLEKEQSRVGELSNPDIDTSKTHYNYDLIENDLNLYQRVKNRIECVKINSRVQKNSIVDCSNIITVPKEQSIKWGIEKTKKYFEEVCNFFKQEFGSENVVSAMIHFDESAPHMHLHFVPVSKDEKLQCRNVITRTKINEIHDNAPKYLRECGFDIVRGEGKTKNSLEIFEYKRQSLKQDIKEFEIKLESLKSDFEHFSDVKAELVDLNNIQAKKSFIGSKIIISENEYESLMKMAQKSIVLNDQYKKLKNELEWFQKDNSNSSKALFELQKDNSKLKNNNSALKSDLKKLLKQATIMKDVLSKHDLLVEAKEIFQNVKAAEKISEKILNKTFDLER